MLILTTALSGIMAAAVAVDVYCKKKGIFPFISFACGYYLTFYGFISLYAGINHDSIPSPGFPSSITFSSGLSIVSFVAALVGGYWAGVRFLQPCVNAHRENDRATIAMAVIMVIAAFSFLLYPALNDLPSIPQIRHSLWYFGFAVLMLAALEGRLSFWLAGVLAVFFLTKLAYDVSQGFITPIIFTLVLFASAALNAGSKRLVIAAVAAVMLVTPFYGYVKYFSRTVIHGVDLHINDFTPTFDQHAVRASINAVARRSSPALVFEEVARKTPSVIEYSDHSPFLTAVLNHVPRAVWPTKPTETMGNLFGRRYDLIAENDLKTSWNLPWLIEFYMIGGHTFLPFYGLGIGCLLGAAVALMSSGRDRLFRFGLFSSSVFPLFYQESNFSLMTGSVLTVIVALMAIRWGIGRGWRLVRAAGKG